MISLSAVMCDLRAELGLGPDDYVPDELVTAAITEHLRAQREQAASRSSDDRRADQTH